jgi:hypothetical protein
MRGLDFAEELVGAPGLRARRSRARTSMFEPSLATDWVILEQLFPLAWAYFLVS